MGLITVTIAPKKIAPRREYVQRACQKALRTLATGDAVRAWSDFVSDLLKHPETKDHPVIWEGTKKITDIKVFTADSLQILIEQTAKAEIEQ